MSNLYRAGYEKTCTLNFGPVDWRHDPRIFGLEAATALSMEHALESYLGGHASLADVLLGERWDARPVAAGNAFRVVLTMRVAVDEMQVRMYVRPSLSCFVLITNNRKVVIHHVISCVSSLQDLTCFVHVEMCDRILDPER